MSSITVSGRIYICLTTKSSTRGVVGDVKRVELLWCYANPSTDIISADAAKWVRAYPLDGERGQDVSRGSEHQIWGHVV